MDKIEKVVEGSINTRQKSHRNKNNIVQKRSVSSIFNSIINLSLNSTKRREDNNSSTSNNLRDNQSEINTSLPILQSQTSKEDFQNLNHPIVNPTISSHEASNNKETEMSMNPDLSRSVRNQRNYLYYGNDEPSKSKYSSCQLHRLQSMDNESTTGTTTNHSPTFIFPTNIHQHVTTTTETLQQNKQYYKSPSKFIPSSTTMCYDSTGKLPLNILDKFKLSSSSSLSTHGESERKFSSKSRERTPDWISAIFVLAKKGKLDELKEALMGLEPTLIRHFVDSKGNTILHAASERDNVATLEWIVSLLDTYGLSEPILRDVNRKGRTVLLATLESRRQKCFQWLVLNTSCGEVGLVPRDGKKSLLHYAAMYGNPEATQWLSEQLFLRNIPVDIRDTSGASPLHLAGENGHVGVVSILIRAGADPLCQMESGSRPLDLALRHRHSKCANYLMLAEAAGAIGSDHNSLLIHFTLLHQHYQLLQNHFREILEVGKCLVRDRSEMIKSLTKGESWDPTSPNPYVPDGTLLTSSNGIRFSEMEHKLLRAEHIWKELSEFNWDENDFGRLPTTTETFEFTPKVLNSVSRENIHSVSDILRKRLAEVESRRDKNFVIEASGPLLTLPSSSSSEGTDDSEKDSSSSSENEDDENHHSHQHHFHSHSSPDTTNPSNQPSRHGHVPIRTSRSQPSKTETKSPTSAPWLLTSDESILNVLIQTPRCKGSQDTNIQILPNLVDLTDLPSLNTSFDFPSQGMKLQSPSSLHEFSLPTPKDFIQLVCNKRLEETILLDSQQPMSPSVPLAAVLEVIEPFNKEDSKEIHETPDLIRATRHIRCRRYSEEDGERSGTEKEQITLEEIYRDVKGLSLPLSRDTYPSNEFVQKNVFGNPKGKNRGLNFNIPLVESKSGGLSLSERVIGTSNETSTLDHVLNVLSESNETGILVGNQSTNSNLRKPSLDKSFNLTSILPLTSSVVPSRKTTSPNSRLMIHPVEDTGEEISSKDTPPLIQGSHSSMSSLSPTLHSLSFFLSSNNDDEESVSPAMSETSNTESTLAGILPPAMSSLEENKIKSNNFLLGIGPTNENFCFHGQTEDTMLLDQLLLSNSYQAKKFDTKNSVPFGRFLEREDKIYDKSKEDYENDTKESMSRNKLSGRPFPEFMGHTTSKIPRQLLISKPSIHFRSKSRNRSAPKAWYEVEGSDEEQSTLLTNLLKTRPNHSFPQPSTTATPTGSRTVGSEPENPFQQGNGSSDKHHSASQQSHSSPLNFSAYV